MRRLAWLVIPLLLAGCGGGKPSVTLSVVCTGGVQVVGATSIDVLGDVVNGRPTMNFPSPTRSGKTDSISVDPRGSCKITPQTS
jgi:hypothetical protein